MTSNNNCPQYVAKGYSTKEEENIVEGAVAFLIKAKKLQKATRTDVLGENGLLIRVDLRLKGKLHSIVVNKDELEAEKALGSKIQSIQMH